MLHRDVKGSNLLVDNDGNVKLADFGLATRRLPEDREPLTSTVVTLWYRPPELLLGATKYDEGVDMWSVGCLLAELLLGKPAFQGQTEVEQLHRIFQTCGSEGAASVAERLGGYTIGAPSGPTYPRRLRERFAESPNIVDPHALDLVDALLSLDPRDRGSAAEAMRNPYFTAEPAPEPLSLAHMPNSHEYTVRHNISKARSSGVSWTRGLVLNEGDNFGGDDTPSAIHSQSSSFRSSTYSRSGRSTGKLTFEDTSPGRCSKPQRWRRRRNEEAGGSSRRWRLVIAGEATGSSPSPFDRQAPGWGWGWTGRKPAAPRATLSETRSSRKGSRSRRNRNSRRRG